MSSAILHAICIELHEARIADSRTAHAGRCDEGEGREKPNETGWDWTKEEPKNNGNVTEGLVFLVRLEDL